MQYSTLKVQRLEEGKIVRISLCRPKTLNAINTALLQDLQRFFGQINQDNAARVVILQGDGRLFCSGLDLKEMSQIFSLQGEEDAARRGIFVQSKIKQMQQQFLSIYQCRVPVLVGLHKLCIGAGMDLIAGIDIKYCTQDWFYQGLYSVFAIKEIDLGLATDIGSLQFYPRCTASSSAFKELAYTGRNFGAQEALRFGFVSKIFEDKQKMSEGLLETAQIIAGKSPVGTHVIKRTIAEGEKDIYSGLHFMTNINSMMLQTQDTFEAFSAFLDKRKPEFPKL